MREVMNGDNYLSIIETRELSIVCIDDARRRRGFALTWSYIFLPARRGRKCEIQNVVRLSLGGIVQSACGHEQIMDVKIMTN